MDELLKLIINIHFNKKIEVVDKDNNHYCEFGFDEPQNGDIKVNQKGEVYITCDLTSDQLLEDEYYKAMEYAFDKKHGVPLAYMKYIAQAYDSISRRLNPNHSNNEMDDLLQDIRAKISEECKEFTDIHNIGKGIVWCSAIRNFPQDYIDMVEGKKTEKRSNIDEYYINLKKGDKNPFTGEISSIINEDVSIAARYLKTEDIEEDDCVSVLIEPKHDYFVNTTNTVTNIDGTMRVKTDEQYIVSTKLLSFEPHYKEARKAKHLNLNLGNPKNRN